MRTHAVTPMLETSGIARNIAALSGLALVLACLPALAATSYSGRATGASALGLTVGDTTALPAGGGEKIGPNVFAGLKQGPVTVGAQALTLRTVGVGDKTDSSAQLSGVKISVMSPLGLNLIDLDAKTLAASAVSQCSAAGVASRTGSSTVTGLKINNKPVSVSGAPNQKISIPGVADVFLNEQLPVPTGMTVNALRVSMLAAVLPGVDVVVASATSGITCDPPPPPAHQPTSQQPAVLPPPTLRPRPTFPPAPTTPAPAGSGEVMLIESPSTPPPPNRPTPHGRPTPSPTPATPESLQPLKMDNPG